MIANNTKPNGSHGSNVLMNALTTALNRVKEMALSITMTNEFAAKGKKSDKTIAGRDSS